MRVKMSKQLPPAPAASAVGSCATISQKDAPALEVSPAPLEVVGGGGGGLLANVPKFVCRIERNLP